jgi:putative transposase
VEPVVLPPRSPNLNAHCERFVRSIKEEALEQMIILGERALYDAIHQYLAHYHMERNHQGLDNQLIAPEPGMRSHSGQVRRRDRLGGLLSYYYRGVTRRCFSTIRGSLRAPSRAAPPLRPATAPPSRP